MFFPGSGFCEIKYHSQSGPHRCPPLPPDLSKLMRTWCSPSDPCEIMYHACQAAAGDDHINFDKSGEGGRRLHTKIFPDGI